MSKQPFSSQTIDETRRRFYRVDADIRFSAAGQHHVRFGFDNEDLSENKVTQLNGTLPIQYQYYDGYAYLIYEHLGGHVVGERYRLLHRRFVDRRRSTGLTLNLGLRDDVFRQYQPVWRAVPDFKNNWGPRLAFNYSPPALRQLEVLRQLRPLLHPAGDEPRLPRQGSLLRANTSTIRPR